MILPGKLPLLLVAFAPFTYARTDPQVIWQIGKFDQSPVEFQGRPSQSFVFRPGAEDAKRWPDRQETGQSYQILFPLNSVAGTYLLKIGTLIEQPRVPALRININGHAGTFYLHPKLSYSRSDFSYAFDPHESQSSLEIDIPPSLLKPGGNAITITCVDDPATTSGAEELGGISYDALSLQQNPSAQYQPGDPKIDVEPTIFYRNAGDHLTEVVDTFIRFPRPWSAGTVDLDISGRHYDAHLKPGEFGEQRVSVNIPEWTGTKAGRVRVIAGVTASSEVTLEAQRKWTMFVVPHTHLDIGFTDYQGKVAETQARVLSQAETLIHEHPDFRFSMDGSWNLQQLLQTRPKPKRDEILNLIRTGKMAMPVQYCNLLTDYASLETLYRSLYDSKKLSRLYDLPFEYANITDVPTYSGSYPSILAGSGVKYWVAASNNDRAPIFYYDHWNEKSPFWWQGPDGKKVLFWYSRHYEQVQTLFGLSPQLNAVRESLPIYLQAYSKPAYKPDVALLYGTQVENTDLVPSTATFADDWNKQYAFPKLNYATFPDFFHYVDARFGRDLPTFQGDGGGYWEDGIGSDIYFEVEDRHNQNRALSAEVLSSVTHSIDANLNPPVGAFADIWRNIILFAEHTWLSYNSVSQPDHAESIKQLRVKDDRADRASLQIEDVMNRSLSQLADRIHIPANTLVVFNSLSWQRDAVVETDLFEHPKLVDLTTHAEVPLEVLYEKEKFIHVRFLASDLPAVGYKCFSITYGEHGPASVSKPNTKTVENGFYRITIDEGGGALASIYDKQLRRDVVDSGSPYKFGQYLYVTGGDGDTQMINPFPALPPGQLTVHPASHGKFLGVEQMPWGYSIRLTSSSVNTPEVRTEILVFNKQKKIEFLYRIHKKYTTAKEAAYFAFPVAASNPEFSFASQQGWINPARDLMKGGSLEWFNVQQWMAVHNSNTAVGIVPVDASLASFGDINRGKWPGEFQPKTGTIFSYVMNNYWHTNYRTGQGGEFTFRYTVTSGAQLDGGELARLGWEEMRPAELNYVVSQDKVGDPPRPLPAGGEGFLDVAARNISLITWKKAEDENGMILRLAESSGKGTRTALHFLHSNLESAQLCSGVEDNLRALPVDQNGVELAFEPFEVVTLRITTK